MNLTNSVKHPPALMAVKRRSRCGVRGILWVKGEGGGGGTYGACRVGGRSRERTWDACLAPRLFAASVYFNLL